MSDPVRLLYSFPHPLGSPGIGRTAWHQVQGAIDEGLEVTVSCTSVAVPVERAHRVIQTMAVGGRRVPHRAVGIERALRHHDRSVARLLAEGRPRFDLVHCWPLASEHTLVAARAAATVAVREVPNAHTAVAYDLSRREAERVGVELPRRHSHRPDEQRLAREHREYALATALLAPSDFVERSFAGREPHAPLVRHRYGYDPARFPAPGPRPERPFTVAFVGSGEPRKGLHHALDAWARSGIGTEGGRLVVCGRVLPAYRARLVEGLAQAGVVERAFTDDVGEVLRGADVLVLPSVEEGSALVTYEAQASGCALLVSDATGAMLEPGVHGLVHRPGDVATLARQMRSLFDRPAVLSRMRAAVLDRRVVLSWERAAQRLVQAYEEARCASHTGPS